MLNIEIEDQEVEEFVKKEYKDNMKSLNKGFVDYLKNLKIRQDIEHSKFEFQNGEHVGIDEVFEKLILKYAD